MKHMRICKVPSKKLLSPNGPKHEALSMLKMLGQLAMHRDSQSHLVLSLGFAHDQLGEETSFFSYFFKLSDSLFGYIFLSETCCKGESQWNS